MYEVYSINCRENLVQQVIDGFKGFVQTANQIYEKKVIEAHINNQREEEQELKRKFEQEEARMRVIKSTKV